MSEKNLTDEQIKKFIDTHGMKAWIELLSGGKSEYIPKQTKGGAASVAETVKGFLSR